MVPSLKKAAGDDKVIQIKAETIGEDFSYFQEEIPGFYFYLGVMKKGNTVNLIHIILLVFMSMKVAYYLGVKALTQMTLDYLNQN